VNFGEERKTRLRGNGLALIDGFDSSMKQLGYGSLGKV